MLSSRPVGPIMKGAAHHERGSPFLDSVSPSVKWQDCGGIFSASSSCATERDSVSATVFCPFPPCLASRNQVRGQWYIPMSKASYPMPMGTSTRTYVSSRAFGISSEQYEDLSSEAACRAVKDAQFVWALYWKSSG